MLKGGHWVQICKKGVKEYKEAKFAQNISFMVIAYQCTNGLLQYQ